MVVPVLSRRETIKLSALTGLALTIPADWKRSAPSPTSPGDPPLPPPFSQPLRIPPVLKPVRSTPSTDFHHITIRETAEEVLPGCRTMVMSYNGSFPGPTIRARRGRTTVVTYTNAMSDPAVVHLHGANVPVSSDGYPLDIIAPGSSKVYRYPNDQPAATLWYHDHVHHMESEHVYRGLAGAYLLSDQLDRRLPLPRGPYDVPLMIRDAKFDEQGQLVFVHDDFMNRPTTLVNGSPQPYFDVEPRMYRLRLINGSNLERFRFRLSTGTPFVQIASDGGFLRHPVVRQEVELWPAERAEVLVDFRSVRPGTSVVLGNMLVGDGDSKRHLMLFRVGHRPWWAGNPAHEVLPTVLAEPVSMGRPVRTRRFALRRNPVTGEFQINGKSFDPARVDAWVKHGTSEIWELVNEDVDLQIPHAIHLHLVQFRVLDRNGVPEPSYQAYPKDTVKVHPGDVVRIQAKFNTYLGRYPFHCHFIDHSTHSMMAQFEVVR